MVTINLLPWRAKQARYEKRVLLCMLFASVVCVALVLACADHYLSAQQQAVVEQLEHLKKELAWRERLLTHTQRHETTQKDNMTLFFKLLNESNAREVCFEQIKRNKADIAFSGLASSSEQLAAFLKTSSLSSYFTEIKVNQLQQYNGQLKFNLVGKTHAI